MSLSLEELHLYNYMKMVPVSLQTETENVYRQILNNSNQSGEFNLKAVLASINNVIKKFNFEIVEAVDEVTGKDIHCLICTKARSNTQKTDFYDKTTCELLSKIIEECVKSENSRVSEITCLNVTTSTNAKKSSIQSSLQRLIQDKWVVSESGKISLGMRSLLELELPIKNQYSNYIKFCGLCKSLVMQGITCQECESRTHFHCLEKYCQLNNLSATNRVCPICKESLSQAADDMDCSSSDETVAISDPPAKRSRTS
ncbi:UNVERIFIED_CONTAM: hypothetical protein PYX00_007366 [Menopon gallinae]|uniref:Non-structural maintenance of chromosomes element 1 homolog n=1 Tax=Menopon gallinae TaxID=328185 RepID=A0AAW2HIY2_9NEOP